MALQGVHCVAHSPLGHGKSDVLTAPGVQQAAEQTGKTAAQVGVAPSPRPFGTLILSLLEGWPALRGLQPHVGIHIHLSKTMLVCVPCNRCQVVHACLNGGTARSLCFQGNACMGNGRQFLPMCSVVSQGLLQRCAQN